MKALVTGVAGFIGSALARRLLSGGHTVRGIDSMTDYYAIEAKKVNLASLHASSAFEFWRDDLRAVDMADLLDGVDVVFHFAGQPGVRGSWGRDFGIYLDHNVHSTQLVLEAAVRHPTIRRIVYSSSSSVYGDAETFPTLESATPAPHSPYGVTKLGAEHLCSLYARNFGVPTASLRYFTVYGPGQRPDMAFNKFIRAALTDDEVHVYGDGQQRRDFTYVDDVVSANLAMVDHDVPPGAVFNVAGGSFASVNDALSIIESIHGKKLRVKYMPAIAGDVRNTGGDTARIRSATGWTPRVSLESGLLSEYRWLEQVLTRQSSANVVAAETTR